LLKLLPGFSTLFLMMFTMLYLFAVVGIQCFGGVVSHRNPVLAMNSTDPDIQAFVTGGGVGYWANNFNDLPSAVVTLFELMVVNNWSRLLLDSCGHCFQLAEHVHMIVAMAGS
jgi:hypothetical protein